MTTTHLPADAAGNVHIGGPWEIDEGFADGAVTPGAVLIKGTNEDDVSEAGADTTEILGYALENDWREIDPADLTSTSTPFFDNFADNAVVKFNKAVGAEFNGLLAAGENVSRGDALKTAAAGELALRVDTGTAPDDPALGIFIAQENVDNSAGTAAVRIHVKRVS